MQTVDWFWLIHPVLAVVVVYPLLGMWCASASRPVPGDWERRNSP